MRSSPAVLPQKRFMRGDDTKPPSLKVKVLQLQEETCKQILFQKQA